MSYDQSSSVFAERWQSSISVEQSVQRFSAFRQFVQVSLQHFGETVEQRPQGAVFEFLIPRNTPFLQDHRDLSWRTRANLRGANWESISNETLRIYAHKYECVLEPL
jgi:hypothetical protein